MDIKITIADKHCTVHDAPVIVCGNSTYTITFTFDAEWDQVEKKTARFSYVRDGVRHSVDVDLIGDKVAVPPMHKTREVQVGVYAEGNITSTPARIPCKKSIVCADFVPEDFYVGYEAGQKAEYDRFWDAYQQNGERTNYSHGFTGSGWTDETFKPKYPLRIVGSAESMCANSAFTEIPVAVDFSQCDNIYYAFTFNSNLVRLPRMDISKVRSSTYAFRQCSSLEEIECLVFSENTLLTNNTFYYASKLKHLTVEGTINTELNFAQSSMLTNESVQSIIDHLKDLTGATAKTLTFHATVGGKLTDEQKADISAKNWTLVY